jgi:hypothetical protein
VKLIYSHEITENDISEKFSIMRTKDDEFILTMATYSGSELTIMLSRRDILGIQRAIYDMGK